MYKGVKLVEIGNLVKFHYDSVSELRKTENSSKPKMHYNGVKLVETRNLIKFSYNSVYELRNIENI